MGNITKVFRHISGIFVKAALRRPRIILFLWAFILLVGFYAFSHIKLYSDMFRLLGSSNNEVKKFEKVMNFFPATDTWIVVVDVKSDSNREDIELIKWSHAAVGKIKDTKGIKDLLYTLDDPKKVRILKKYFYKRVLLFLTESELKEFFRRISPSNVRAELSSISNKAILPLRGVGVLARRDPLHVMLPLIGKNPLSKVGFRLVSKDGILLTRDRKTAVILFRTDATASDIAENKKIISRLKSSFKDIEKDAEVTGIKLKISLTGKPVIAVDDYDTVRRDVISTLGVTVILVLFLFWLFFGSLSSLVIAATPLIAALAFAGGIAYVVFGELNSLTCVFGAIVVGLGIDFSIHMLHRLSKSTDHDMESAATDIGSSMILGALTTAGAFFILLFSEIAGVRQLAFLSGIGVLAACAAALTIVPALRSFGINKFKSGRTAFLSQVWEGLPVENVTYKRAVLLFFLFICIVAAVSVPALFKPEDRAELHTVRSDAVRTYMRLREKVKGGMSPAVFVFGAKSKEEGLTKLWNTGDYLNKLRDLHKIAFVENAAFFLPPKEHQKKILNMLSEFRKRFSPATFKQAYLKELHKVGMDSDTYLREIYPNLIISALNNTNMITEKELRGLGLGPLLDRGIKYGGGDVGWRFALYIYPPSWKGEADFDSIKDAFESLISPDVIATGIPILVSYWRGLVKKELPLFSVAALLFVAILLYFTYRGRLPFVLVLMPLVGGVALTLVLMRFLGIDINIFNMAVLPMIIGIGIDDGIYFTDRWLNCRQMKKVLSDTGNAILLTSLTTAVGFGTFLFAGFGGLRYVGGAGGLGLLCCWAATMLFLPVFLLLKRE